MIDRTRWFQQAAALAAAVLLALPAGAGAQVGAIGAAPGSITGGDDVTAGTPILGESAFLLGRGQAGGSAMIGSTAGTVKVGVTNVDFTYNQLLLAGFYAPTDRVMVGVMASPYQGYTLKANGNSVDDNGRGDAALYGKGLLWRSPRGETRLALFGSLLLPVAQDGWGHEGAAVGAGLAVSHALERVTLHASGGFDHPMKSADGKTSFDFSGAGVYAASPRVGVVGEMLLSTSDGEYTLDLAPGARVRLGKSFFLSGSVLANAASSLDQKPYTAAFVLGAQLVK